MDGVESERPTLGKIKHLTVETSRRPLTPSEKDDGDTGRSSVREVSSRYRSPSPVPSSARRCPSPNATRTPALSTASLPKRAISAERNRPTMPSRPSRPSSPSTRSPSTPVSGSVVEAPSATKKSAGNKLPEGLWPSTMRSLSASLQSVTLSVPFGKREKPPPQAITDRTLRSSANLTHQQGVMSPSSQKPTPERTRSPLKGKSLVHQSENLSPVDSSNSQSVDRHRRPTSAGGKLSSSASKRNVDLSDKTSRPSSTSFGTRKPSIRMFSLDGAAKALKKSSSDLLKVMSSTNSLRGGSRGRSCDDNSTDKTSSVTDKPLELSVSRPQSPSKASMLSSSLSRGVSPSRTKPISPAPSRGTSSPRVRPSSPRVMPSSPQVRSSSPRVRPSSPRVPSSPSRQTSTTASVFSFIIDIKKGNKAENQIEDAHRLGLLHNTHLQWRYVNARAHSLLQLQKEKSEKILCNVWITLSDMSESLIAKRIEVQQLRLKLKLYSVLSEQLEYLDQWNIIESEHMDSLSLIIQDLKDCSIRLPVVGGARGDIESVKAAVCSAVDIMQAMASSICALVSPVEGMNSLIAELADVAAQQRALLDECEALMASMTALQVEEFSLRTNLVQFRQSLQRS